MPRLSRALLFIAVVATIILAGMGISQWLKKSPADEPVKPTTPSATQHINPTHPLPPISIVSPQTKPLAKPRRINPKAPTKTAINAVDSAPPFSIPPSPDTATPSALPSHSIIADILANADHRNSLPSNENPCFTIHTITVEDESGKLDNGFNLPEPLKKSLGKCLGTNSVNFLLKALQNQVVEDGYATTRIYLPAQDLSSGTLRLVKVDGHIGNIRFVPDTHPRARWESAMPIRTSDILNVHDLEQGIDQFKRVPTTSAEFKIIPTEKAGISDIDISWQQSKWWRVAGSIDDSGTEKGGKYQGSFTASIDHPFTLNDILSITLRENLQKPDGNRNQGASFHYSAPYGWWNFAINHSQGGYRQNIQGAYIAYDYTGKNKSTDIEAKRLLFRNSARKIYTSLKIETKDSNNFIDAVEVEVQRRKTSAYTLSVSDQEYFGVSSFDIAMSYYVGTSWFGALPAPEEEFNEGTARPKIWRMNIQAEVPFANNITNKPQMRYGVNLFGQQTSDRLIPQDTFSIGSRWSVRGFDGEQSLTSESGYYIRNELGWYYARSFTNDPHQIYLGLDYGAVSGYSAQYLVGKSLTGAVLGLRGEWNHINYEIFSGKPISKPDTFKTTTAQGFSVSVQY